MLRTLLPTLAASLLAATAIGQRVMLPETKNGLMLQLFDLHGIRGPVVNGVPATNGLPTRSPVDQTADMLRKFVTRPMTDEQDVRGIGKRWIAVIGDAELIAEVERLYQTAKQRKHDFIDVEVRLLDIESGAFHKHVEPKMTRIERGESATFETVIGKQDAKEFLQTTKVAKAEAIVAPRLTVLPMQPAQVSIINQTAYVKDFTVERTNLAAIADPIVDTIWDGNITDVCATFLPDGRIGLSCDVKVQELHRPIPELEVEVLKDAPKVTIQLPRTSGVRLRNVAELDSGSMVVLAAQRQDGNFMVAIVKATSVATVK